MQIGFDAIIDRRKIDEYLLVERSEGDKSGFLALGGFGPHTSAELETAIRSCCVARIAEIDRTSRFGTYYVVRTLLAGLNGRHLPVRIVWIVDLGRTVPRFITLVPDWPERK